MKNFNYKLQYIVAISFIAIIKLFPEKCRFKFAEFLGEMFFKFEKKRKAIALANISLAFPNMPQNEKERIILKSYKVLFKAFLSTLWFEEYFHKDGNIKIINIEALQNSMSQNKGAIGACMHMGNMESPLKISEHYHVVTVAKKQRNPYIDRLITENREKLNVTLLKKSKSTAGAISKLLDQNSIIALFSDHRDKGTTITFFGRETIAPTGAVALAMKKNIPLHLAYTTLNDDNSTTIYIEDEFKLIDTGNYKEDLQNNIQNLIHDMEKAILKHPEQWMWFHDRWNLSKTLKF